MKHDENQPQNPPQDISPSLLAGVLQRLDRRAVYLAGDMPVQELVAALSHPQWDIRSAAVYALGNMGVQAPVEALLLALSDEHRMVRAAAVRALGKAKERLPLEHLIRALQDPAWEVREMVVLTLGELGTQVPDPLKFLVRTALQDTHEQVRDAARYVLEQYRLSSEERNLVNDVPPVPDAASNLSGASTSGYRTSRDTQASSSENRWGARMSAYGSMRGDEKWSLQSGGREDDSQMGTRRGAVARDERKELVLREMPLPYLLPGELIDEAMSGSIKGEQEAGEFVYRETSKQEASNQKKKERNELIQQARSGQGNEKGSTLGQPARSGQRQTERNTPITREKQGQREGEGSGLIKHTHPGRLRHSAAVFIRQIPLIHKSVWCMTPLLMLFWYVMVVLVRGNAHQTAFYLALITTISAAAGTAFLYGSENDAGLELTLATPTALRGILFYRFLLVVGYNILLSVCASELVALTHGGSVWSSMALWLGPMLLLASCSLMLSILIGSWFALFAACIIEISQSFIVNTNSRLFALELSFSPQWQTSPLLLALACLLVVLALFYMPRQPRLSQF